MGISVVLVALGIWRQLVASSLSDRLEDLWMLLVPVGLLCEARIPALALTDKALCLRRAVAGVAVGTACAEWAEIQRVVVRSGGRRLEIYLDDGRKLASVEREAIAVLLNEFRARSIDVAA